MSCWTKGLLGRSRQHAFLAVLCPSLWSCLSMRALVPSLCSTLVHLPFRACTLSPSEQTAQGIFFFLSLPFFFFHDFIFSFVRVFTSVPNRHALCPLYPLVLCLVCNGDPVPAQFAHCARAPDRLCFPIPLASLALSVFARSLVSHSAQVWARSSQFSPAALSPCLCLPRVVRIA